MMIMTAPSISGSTRVTKGLPLFFEGIGGAAKLLGGHKNRQMSRQATIFRATVLW